MGKIRTNSLLVLIILTAIVVALIVSAFVAFYINFEKSGKIASGVFIKNVNVSRNDEKRS